MKNLELMALRWLRFQKRCPLAFLERGPRNPYGRRPDALGITPARYMVEIEIKRSVSDFRADSKKPHIVFRDSLINRWPKWFYYLVPPSIVDKVQVPEWAGLMTVDDYYVRVRKEAPRNEASLKLSVKECCQLFRVLGNQVLSSEEKAANWQHLTCPTFEPWGIEYQI